MSKADTPTFAFEVHLAGSPLRIVGFRYPDYMGVGTGKGAKKAHEDGHVRPGEIQIAACCFAVLGEGRPFQWPGVNGLHAALFVADCVPGSSVVEADWDASELARDVSAVVPPSSPPTSPSPTLAPLGQVSLFGGEP